ncbi:DUF5946 family protein [Saccharomonospora xinjiangensis]|uniref:Uncharacterized protein n=1 Tax=Saccharomonospora xinjiangensis XJ-54 TaxID=882086 RepID=I0V4T2_9PSEU|nr:DUF5946 family protein [Saccharomonospora xinjiangensis]EID55135.1 hypothetical protein SacxiDRAFT_2922 [Saccharomonospora xinjiangensis XJ-54]
MTGETTACADCGASGRFGTCGELFRVLLALDHERRQPWAAFHSVNVACYLVQHRSQTQAHALAGQWQIVTTFVADGLDAVHQLTADRVRQNRRGARPWLAGDPPPPLTATVTIEDVSVDGTFPAEGYEQRMRRWAESMTVGTHSV